MRVVCSQLWDYGCPREEVPPYARELPKVRTGEPILQFNGKDLTGFYTYLHDSKYNDPRRVFSVMGGMLVISGEEFGGLTTRDEFRDYVLVVEWKWGDRTFGSRKRDARDSGLLLHCVGADGAAGGNWMESQECQIIEGGCGDFIMVGGNGNKPRLTCETRVGPDGQLYFEKGGNRRPATRLASTGGGVTRRGRTCWGTERPRHRKACRRVEPHGSHLRRRLDHQHRQRLCRQCGNRVKPDEGQDHHPVRGSRDRVPQDRDPADFEVTRGLKSARGCCGFRALRSLN